MVHAILTHQVLCVLIMHCSKSTLTLSVTPFIAHLNRLTHLANSKVKPSARMREGYGSCPVCVCVCLSVTTHRATRRLKSDIYGFIATQA